jgi:hypothetical protein
VSGQQAARGLGVHAVSAFQVGDQLGRQRLTPRPIVDAVESGGVTTQPRRAAGRPQKRLSTGLVKSIGWMTGLLGAVPPKSGKHQKWDKLFIRVKPLDQSKK